MDSTVTVKCSPAEYQLMVGAVEYERDQIKETVKVMSPVDGHGLRAKVMKLDDLAKKMRA